MKIGVIYGTTTGTTEEAAESIRGALGLPLHLYKNINTASIEDFSACDVLILGIPTWDVGEPQSDWWAFFPKLDSIDFHGKKIAIFGLGDQYGYPGTFLDAMGDLWTRIKARGGELIGQWPTEGYDFSSAKPVLDGKLIGLGLDPVNQAELTDDRIKKWVAQLKSNLHAEVAS